MTKPEPFSRNDLAPQRGRRLAIVHSGSYAHLYAMKDPAVLAYQPDFVYLPDLDDGALDGYDTVIVGDRMHPDLLARHAPRFHAVSERGGTLVVLGENQVHTWLPGIEWEHRPTNFWWWVSGEDPLIRTRSHEHEAWRYLTTKAVIWHHHGLLRPAADVVPLLVSEEPDADGRPHDAGMLLYEDTVSTAGRLIVTTLDPMHHHGSRFMSGATRFLYALLRWTDQTSPSLVREGR
ncbi:hypothetical protein [Mycolicibacterium smegmatis]|uniref:hypothetical protein n=1 Tax=Mycolicibacterium smegmatis TaxID=1772 RepID=UPI0005D78AD2|nr:hypothetical protein [Mycolicibacterium smegmatis]MDF1898610.1 hypothetical protein [Mycolicibacterium smegmatis]MDF1908839.1 hypothetical protein [Mycolicibacterium smegmatis]MDF1915668.1 hypothetical protein [Mycolicibacterium smegmatis]MDF1927367.1 hypothetical protein [Mycolicibacterium smegmatis]UAK54820.1 hypothetical protein K8P01_30780 [Mycolicibacterium smegmatis]